MKLMLSFSLEKETPGTHRYKEVTEEGKPPVVGSLYLKKSAFTGQPPATLKVEVSAP